MRHAHGEEIPPAHPRRAGFTLSEILVALGITSFVLASATVALASLWRAHGDMQREGDQARTLVRLAGQLRADGHLAASAAIETAANGRDEQLHLNSAATRITYTRGSRRVVRTSYERERIVHREIYDLGDLLNFSWELVGAAPPRLHVAFACGDPRLGDAEPPTRREQLEVTIGLLAGASR